MQSHSAIQSIIDANDLIHSLCSFHQLPLYSALVIRVPHFFYQKDDYHLPLSFSVIMDKKEIPFTTLAETYFMLSPSDSKTLEHWIFHPIRDHAKKYTSRFQWNQNLKSNLHERLESNGLSFQCKADHSIFNELHVFFNNTYYASTAPALLTQLSDTERANHFKNCIKEQISPILEHEDLKSTLKRSGPDKQKALKL